MSWPPNTGMKVMRRPRLSMGGAKLTSGLSLAEPQEAKYAVP